jgi:hypothetical protein
LELEPTLDPVEPDLDAVQPPEHYGDVAMDAGFEGNGRISSRGSFSSPSHRTWRMAASD